MRFALFSLSMLCLFLPSRILATTQKNQTINLKEAVAIALRFNPQLQIAGLTRILQKYDLAIVKNQYEWQYAMNASSQYSWDNDAGATGQSHGVQAAMTKNFEQGGVVAIALNNTLNNANGSNNPLSDNPSVSVSFNQPLLRGFGAEIALAPLANALDQKKIERLSLQQTVIDTIMKVASDYSQVLSAKKNLKIQQLTVNTILQRQQDNQLKIQAGIIAASDNTQVAADLAAATLSLAEANNGYQQNRLNLVNDLGIAPNIALEVTESITLPSAHLPDSAWVQKAALQHDLNYQTALINQRIHQRQALKAQDNARMQLNVIAQGNDALSTLGHSANEHAALGLTLSIPLDTLVVKQVQVATAMQLAEDNIMLDSQRARITNSVLQTMNDLTALKAQLLLAKHSVTQQQQTLTIALEKMHFGMGSALDISLQQKNLTQAQLAYSNNQMHYEWRYLQFRQLIGETLADFAVTLRF